MKHQTTRQLSRLLIAIATVSALGTSAFAQTTYSYNPNNAATDTWGNGGATDWNAAPVSGASNILTFSGNATTFTSGFSNTNTNNDPSTFLVNTINLGGTGPASGAASITITGGTLGLSSGGTINLNAVKGTSGTLTYNLNSAIILEGTSSNTDNIAGAGTATFNIGGGISGAAALSKSGASVVSLNGTQSYTGATTLGAGTLIMGNSSGLGTTSSIKFTGGTLEYSSAFTGSTDYSSLITGSTSAITINMNGQAFSFGTGLASTNTGGLTINDTLGTGSLTLTAANSYTGSTTLSKGTLIVSNANQIPSASTLVIAGGTLQGSGSPLTFTNAITETSGTIGTTTGAGNSALTFSGAYGMNSGAGTLTVNNSQTTFTGPVTISTGASQRTLAVAGSGNVLYSGVISSNAGATPGLAGTGQGVTYSGTGTLTLAATEAYTGATTITSGTIQLGNGTTDGVLPNTFAVTDTAGTLDFDIIGNQALSAAITGAGKVTMNGTGIQTVSGANTYTGITTISSGTLDFAKEASLYNNTPASWTAAKILVGSGGTLGLGVGSANPYFTTSDVTTLLTNLDGAVTSNGLQAGSAIGIDTTNAGGSFTLANSIANTTGTGGGAVGLTKFGTGTLVLSGSSTYTGPTTIANGTLSASNLAAGGNIGSGSSAVVLGSALTSTTGVLSYTGNTGSYSNGVTVTAGGGEIDTTTSGQTLTVGGTISGTGALAVGGAGNTSFSSPITTSGSFTAKATGTGTVTLSGANTYTGTTTVNSGTLVLSAGSTLAGTAVTLSGGVLQVGTTGTAGTNTIGNTGAGSLALNSGGTLTVGNGALNTLDINNTTAGATALTMGGSGTLNFTIGGAGSSDVSEIVLGSGLVASLSGSTTVNVSVIGTLTGTQQQLISWSSETGIITGTTFNLTGITGTPGYTLSLTANSTGLYLNEVGNSTAFWKGGTSASWATIGNFTTDSGGSSPRTAALDNNTSVTFNATGASNFTPTTLDGSYTINNLTFNTGGVGIAPGGGGSLTISSSSLGVSVATGAGSTPDTISANVILGNSQTWSVVDANSTLTVSGNIGQSTTGTNLTKGGNGTLVLSGSNNTYTGATSVNNGYLSIQSAGALNGTSGVSVNSGASLQLKSVSGFTTASSAALTLNGTGVGTAGALENVSGNNNYAGTITLGSASSIGSDAGTLTVSAANISNSGGFTLTLTGAGNGDLVSALSNGALTMSGSGTWAIDGTNTYSGTTTVNSGTLQLGGSGNGTFGSGSNTLTINGGSVDLNGNGLNVGVLTGTGGSIVNNNAGSNFLIISGTTNGTYSGSIANISSGGGALIKQGSNVQTLSGANTYTDQTQIQGGAINIASNGALGTAPSTSTASVTVSSGAALQMSGGITTTVAVPLSLTGTGVAASPNGALENVSGSNTYTGTIALTGATSIGADTGSTLNLSSTAAVTGSGNNLTLVGAGNGNIASAVNLGSGTLTLSSGGTWAPFAGTPIANTTGTWTLSGTNTNGGTAVTNGTLVYTSASVLANSTSITLGSTNAVNNTTANLTYSGSGETVANPLSVIGTNAVILGNTGSGAVNYSATPTFGSGNHLLVLGNATDTNGGTIGGIVNGSGTGATTSLTKNGLTNSTWILNGTNSYTGTTSVVGGVLQVASVGGVPSLPTGELTLSGTSTNTLAVLQTSGTLTMTTGTGVGQLNWSGNAGFSAIGSTLNLNINSGGTLVWNSGGNFGNSGGAILAFGSNTSNAQVVLPNPINLNTNDQFQQNIYVSKGTGGDSTLLSGVISQPANTASASGLTKLGAGTLILSNGANSYSGYTAIEGGTLIADASSAVTVANSTSTSTGVFGSGNGTAAAPNPTLFAPVYVGSAQGGQVIGGVINPTLLIEGANSIANPINIDWANGTNQVFGIGGFSDASSTFSGPITLTAPHATGNTFQVTQVATTGTDALNITGGITTGTAAGAATVNFANVGAVNVSTTGITNGTGGTVSVVQAGSGVTTFSATNAYTGTTTINAGTLAITGSTVSTGTVAVNSGGTLAGTGSTGIVTVAGGGNINLRDGTIGTLTVAGLSSGNASTPSAFSFDIQTVLGTTSTDLIHDTGTLTLTGTNGTTITIGNLSGTTSLITGNYALISYTGPAQSLSNLNLLTTSLDSASLSLTQGLAGETADTIYLTIAGTPPVAFWNGSSGTSWTTTANFNTSATSGTPINSGIGGVTDVVFSTSSPTPTTVATTLDAATSVNSLTFNSSSGNVSISSGTGGSASTLTINAATTTGNGGINTAPNGIMLQSGSGTVAINAPVILGASQTWSNASSNSLTVSGGVTGTGNLALQANSTGGITLSGAAINNTGSITNSGTGSGITMISSNIGSNVTSVTQSSSTSNLVLTGNNTYTGGTAITAGIVYVNNTSGSGTGTGNVTVGSGDVANSGTLAGSGNIGNTATRTTVSVSGGGTISSGPVQTGAPTVTGPGLTFTNTTINVQGDAPATLSFALGSGTNGLVSNPSGGAYNFSNPDVDSTFMTLANGSTLNFAGVDAVSLTDLTSAATLSLRQGVPYLLVKATSGLDTAYTGLITASGFGPNTVYSLDGNGYVVGVETAAGIAANYTGGNLASLNPSYYSPIAISQYGPDGVTPLSGTNVYSAPTLYLLNGDLEVVPEPGTWALMIGGLALLVLIQQRRKSKLD